MYKFPFSLDNKRYHTLNFYNKNHFGKRVMKAVIDAGFTCPNADGTKGVGGCIYCRGGSGYFTARYSDNIYEDVTNQLKSERDRIYKKFPDSLIVAYFQANTNTYAPVSVLEKAYNAALDFGVAGISIGTRADCLSDEVTMLLERLAKKTELTVELGLQTIHDKTAELINRCYSYSEFLAGYEKLKKAGIRTCLHIINGLPGESYKDMIATAKEVGRLAPDGVKIHLLHINKDTVLEKMYLDGKYIPMEKEDYIKTVAEQLLYIPQTTVIERLTGDGDRRYLVAPLWSRDKISVLGGIDKYMAQFDIWQGKGI
ncbi:MAG: TIGR01212 family radical SAM protein [Ruminococcaceae bacterium]|nr:TIGR01212 family radical SAM protein [Oscillospiraceae bacterium]